MNPLRRRVGERDFVGLRIVGRQELGKEGDHIEDYDDHAAHDRHSVLDKTPPHHLQRRGNVDLLFLFLDGKIGAGVVLLQPLLKVSGLNLVCS